MPVQRRIPLFPPMRVDKPMKIVLSLLTRFLDVTDRRAPQVDDLDRWHLHFALTNLLEQVAILLELLFGDLSVFLDDELFAEELQAGE